MSSYDKIKGGKLTFKGGLAPERTIKKKKKKAKEVKVDAEGDGVGGGAEEDSKVDIGTGFAPDGKKSKMYEELFPVEKKRFGYVIQEPKSREEALLDRIKKKSDKFCK